MDLATDMGLAPNLRAVAAVGAAAWREPVAALAPFAEEAHVLLLLSDGSARARWSYLARAPEATLTTAGATDPFQAAAALLCGSGERLADGPPFQGGVAGLFAYEAGLVREPSLGPVPAGRPTCQAGLYACVLAFDHWRRRVVAIGRGADAKEAARRAKEALGWLEAEPPPRATSNRLAHSLEPRGSAAAYRAAVGEVVARIAAGEIFQANIARTWTGRLGAGAAPFDLFARLAAASPAPYAAYLRLPGRAVVSNSPERFIGVDASGRAETRPIKGTRPRGATAEADAALAAELAACAKDRAENLMIVDLMRNDLARACAPGSVAVPELFRLEAYANVHHLVSTVSGRLAADAAALDLLGAAFPPGSVTGAPKVQAMRVIAGCEPPRGAYCGSMVWAGVDGAMDSSVLIRTVAFEQDAEGWAYEFRAGAGIVADSDPVEEDAEAETKAAAIAGALTGAA